MFDDTEYVDDYDERLEGAYCEVSDIVSLYNTTNLGRMLEVVIFKGVNRYAEINIVDAIHNDVVLTTVFTTKMNKVTGKFIIPLDTMIRKDIIMAAIDTSLMTGMYNTLIRQKEGK